MAVARVLPQGFLNKALRASFFALVVAAAWLLTASAHAAEALAPPAASPEARMVMNWALDAGNAQGKPFAVVDKKAARIFVFNADGRLEGESSVLLGQAKGDDSAPGVGERVLTGIPLQQRTTPAGRFDSQPGHNSNGEAIVWVDYQAAVAIHRLRPAPAAQRRPERLASASVEDKRISLGCIVVDPAFYDGVIAPTLGRQPGVVYVLPETRGAALVFNEAASPRL